MSQPGGSATINGILYQILGAIHRAVSIRLTATKDSDDIVEAQLIIEPVGGGGDIRIHFPNRLLVEQWKAKSDRGTWSLHQVISVVIPDLYLAVDNTHLDDHSEYRFVTEGRRGAWQVAQTFFHNLSHNPPPPDPLGSLDGTTKRPFFPDEPCTERELFLRIADAVRQRRSIRDELEQLTYRKLWHLLARFEIVAECTQEYLRQQIHAFLRGAVDYREDVDAKRHELCGVILELAARSEVTITPNDLLRRVGLNDQTVQNWSTLRANLADQLERQVHFQQYRREEDVRTSSEWPAHLPVLLLIGESGQGKTWQLLNLAWHASRGDGLAVLVTGESDATRVLATAADTVWQKGLDRDRPLSLDRVARRIQELVPTAPKPWLTLYIDDLQAPAQVRYLVEQDWDRWQIRVAMAVPVAIGRVLQNQYPDRVHLVKVSDFTSDELRVYLHHRHREWGSIPADVRATLQRPLLAALYCDLTADAGWTPTNEYELFERYWLRIRDARDQAAFPGDIGKMRLLAARILKPGATYPWTPAVLQDVGFNDEVQMRLESIGWLRRLTDGRVEIWHDRLLNWAVAEFLVEQRQANCINAEALGVWLARFHSSKEQFAGKSLAYVPMDVLWLACDPTRGLLGDVPSLLTALEDTQTQGGYPDSLYRDLLPTLGERILPALLARLRGTIDQEFSRHGQFIAAALARIGRKAPEQVRASAESLINEPLVELQEAGMRVLARIPSAAALDRLWDLHKLYLRRIREQKEITDEHATWSFLRDLSFAALRVCSQRQPQWLVQKIHAADVQHDPVWELAYLMANLETPAAKALWVEVKPALFAKMPLDKPRSLINCIRRFRDTTEIPRLEQWLTEKNDFACSAALSALAVLDPDRALVCLSDFPRGELYFSRNWWLPELLISRRTQLQAKLFAMMREPGADVREIADCYQNYENEMDGATVNLLLDGLEREIPKHFNQETGAITPRLSFWLELLGKLSRAELIEPLHARSDSHLDALLTTVACSRLGRAGRSFDLDLHNARLLLLKIGGSGITTLVNKELAHPDFYARLDGLAWALVKPDSETRRLLRNITESDRLTGTPPEPSEQLLATRALAALHEDEAVIQSVLRWGLHAPADLTEWWEGHAPVSSERLQTAIVALESEDISICTNAVLVVGMSGQKDLAPRIRQILSTAPGSSELALAAVLALGDLGDANRETIRLLQGQLDVPEHRLHAAKALFRIKTPEALDSLEQYLQRIASDFELFWNVGIRVVLVLAKNPLKRRSVAKILWAAMKEQPLPLWPIECLEIIGEVDDAAAQEWLRELAFPIESPLPDAGRLDFLIRGLAKFDTESAFQAAALALRRTQDGGERIPRLLLDLNVESAIPVLCDHMPQERHTLMRWTIGRALRQVEKVDLVRQQIEEMLKSPDSEIRQAGAELCGWQGVDDLQDALYNLYTDNMNEKVRGAAREALLRQRDQKEIRQFFDMFRVASNDERWRVLEAIIELGDPYLLGNRGDPLWLGQILGDAEFALVKHAEKRLEENIKERRRRAEQADREANQAA